MSDTISRRPARSGQVDFGDPVVLHDTDRLLITLVPFFIDRSETDQLACKIVRYDKRNSKETSISLQSSALHILREALTSHLLIAREDAGSYIILRADGSVSRDTPLTVAHVANAIRDLLQTDGIAEHLSNVDLGEELADALQLNLHLRELREAVLELENYLRAGEADESLYQDWCERHSWAFGNAYVVNDRIRSISAGDQIDLLLPRHLGGFRDLIELKRPDMVILRWNQSHRNWYWSAEVSKAIGQCHRYLDVLHSEVGLGKLRDAPNVIAYHPRATIVIGRSEGWSNDKHLALHGLNRRLSDISVISYDHLFVQARQTLEIVQSPDEGVSVPSTPGWDPDDPPF